MPLADDVWIVIAAYNEDTRLGQTLRAVCGRWPNVVVVDDGSTDATVDVALEYRVWLVKMPFNCGQGAALQTGIDFALERGARILVTFDADGQHAADDIARIIAPISGGAADVALGSRFLGSAVGMPAARWLILKLGVLFTRVFSGIRVSDTHNGLRAFSRRAAEQIRITQNRMAHASEILDQIRRLDISFREVPVTIRYHADTLRKGQSAWNGFRIVGQMLLGRLIP